MSLETKMVALVTKVRADLRQLRSEVEVLQVAGGTSPATETVAGVMEIATQAETDAGTDNTRAVSPLKFQTRLAAFAQPLNANLTTLAGVVSGTFGRTLLTSATAAAAKTSLALVKADVGLANVDNTSDANKPISTATQAALDLKATTSSLTKASVGLGNVDNTSDANKPVSTAQQAALDLKANLTQLTKANVGLGNVDNTSDANKPVSTAQQAALNLKANLVANLVGFGQLETHSTYTTFAAITDFGYHYVQGTSGGPGISGGIDQYYCLSLSLGSEYPYSQYVCQIAIKRGVADRFGIRFREAGTWGSWDIVGDPPTKAEIGLGNVDNTSDANKPVSTAQQAALDLKANIASPALTGTPTAPTAPTNTNTTQIATTAFVQAVAFSSSGTLPPEIDGGTP